MMKVLVFSEGPKKPCRFAMKDRIVVENGVTTIRPYRKGQPSGTPKELEKAFADFAAAIKPDGLFPLQDDNGRLVEEFEIDLESHNRSL